jgi:cyclase
MLKTRVIPVLLLKGSSIVKTIEFDQPRIVGDAIATIKVFSVRKADEMIIVDIDATRNGNINKDLIERISKSCHMPLTLGGGIASMDDADVFFRRGADKITINSAFYSTPDLVKQMSEKYGEQAIVFSLDAKHTDSGVNAMSHGGSIDTGVAAVDAALSAVDHGAGEIYLNSVDRDGRMCGYDLELVKTISDAVSVPVIAAGGCGDKNHCVEVIKAGADAVAAASIFFWVGESVITIKEELNRNGIEVRFK